MRHPHSTGKRLIRIYNQHGWTIMPDYSGGDDSGYAVRLTKNFGMNEEGTELAGRAPAVVGGCISLRKSFGRALSLTQ